MLKKWFKRCLIFSVVIIALGALMGGGNDSSSSSPSKKSSDTQASESNTSSSIVPADEAIPHLFSDLSSEQSAPEGAQPDTFALLERVRDSDGDLKTEDGFKIRASNSSETRTVDDLVFVGTTPSGLKLYVPSDSKYIKIDEATGDMSLVVLCPQLNQGMDWKAKYDFNTETFSPAYIVTVNAEGQSLTFTTKPGDKVYEFLAGVVWVTDMGKKTMEMQSKMEEIAKSSR